MVLPSEATDLVFDIYQISLDSRLQVNDQIEVEPDVKNWRALSLSNLGCMRHGIEVRDDNSSANSM